MKKVIENMVLLIAFVVMSPISLAMAIGSEPHLKDRAGDHIGMSIIGCCVLAVALFLIFHSY